MERIKHKQHITLFRTDMSKSVHAVRTVRNIYFNRMSLGLVGEIRYKGFLLAVGEVCEGTWASRHPILTKRERARMLMEEDR